MAEPRDDAAHLWAWRHPRAQGAAGRCIGRTDLRVDARKAKRLAHRIRQAARRHGLPHEIVTSPLRRCADVGRWLRRWGWRHRTDAALMEMDFGAWDGLRWEQVGHAAVEAWCADFADARPGGGESLRGMLARAAAWTAPAPALLVTHGGWMLARQWAGTRAAPPRSAAEWPAAPRHGSLWRLPAAALRAPR
ncbi:histidine phosphatase family protein [Azohydromonas aeria]|uniref:histidine phosphatase family protein n=1 Tax=Azohydromonas aeria TaxID=2590212 RepID=UPI0012F8B239|nr:histidine phosphatase family protein [Azohydromonas aeria]